MIISCNFNFEGKTNG